LREKLERSAGDFHIFACVPAACVFVARGAERVCARATLKDLAVLAVPQRGIGDLAFVEPPLNVGADDLLIVER